MTRTILFAFLLAGFVFFFYACQKTNDNSNGTADTDIQSVSDYSFAQNTNDDAASISSQCEDNRLTGTITDSTHGLFFSSCVVVRFDLSQSPQKMTIDFGNTNCLCYDGKYRRGKIVVFYTGLYRDSASSHTITYDNYYVNDYKVEGTQTVVNKGHNASGNLVFSVQVNSTLTDAAGRKLTYTSTRSREWISGERTAGLFDWTDDVYRISGTASGTTFAGTSYTATITEPLVIALNCRWVEAGTLSFTPQGELTRAIDFGTGGCDTNATVTIAGFAFAITLL